MHPEWQKCIDTVGNAVVLQLIRLQELSPSCPPTCVLNDPAGGFIIERRGKSSNGDEIVCNFNVDDVGKVEYVEYKNGRVITLKSVDNLQSELHSWNTIT